MKQLVPIIEHKRDGFDSLISYAVGGGGVSVGFLSPYEGQINSIILIVSLAVVFIRLAYDGLKFFDYLKERMKKSGD